MKAAWFGLILVTFTGCISVSVGSSKSQHASGVQFREPPKPFQKTSAENVDMLWRNPKNGNSLSFLSDCSDESDPPLSNIEQGVLAGLAPYTYQSQVDTTFEGRAARRISVEGHVDGIASMVDLLIFKKNNCIYILTFAGLEKRLHENGPVLDKFISGFHAP